MLSFTSKFGGVVAAAALAIGFAGAAPAATITWAPLPAVSTGTPVASAKFGEEVIENNAKDVVGLRFGPWSGTPDPVAGVSQIYTSVGKNDWIEYTFGGVRSGLRFVWGTVDTANKVVFYRNGIEVDSVTEIGTGKNRVLPYATIQNIGTGGFDTVRFTASARTFEFANISAIANISPIPVPAAGLLLLTALGAVTVLRRRKSA